MNRGSIKRNLDHNVTCLNDHSQGGSSAAFSSLIQPENFACNRIVARYDRGILGITIVIRCPCPSQIALLLPEVLQRYCAGATISVAPTISSFNLLLLSPGLNCLQMSEVRYSEGDPPETAFHTRIATHYLPPPYCNLFQTQTVSCFVCSGGPA